MCACGGQWFDSNFDNDYSQNFCISMSKPKDLVQMMLKSTARSHIYSIVLLT